MSKHDSYSMDGKYYDLKIIKEGITNCNKDAYRASLPPRYGFSYDPSVNNGECKAIKPEMCGLARSALRAKSKAEVKKSNTGARTYLPLGFMSRGPAAVAHLDQKGGLGEFANPIGGHIVQDPFRHGEYSYTWNAPYGDRFSSDLNAQARLSGLHSKAAACLLPREPVGVAREEQGDMFCVRPKRCRGLSCHTHYSVGRTRHG